MRAWAFAALAAACATPAPKGESTTMPAPTTTLAAPPSASVAQAEPWPPKEPELCAIGRTVELEKVPHRMPGSFSAPGAEEVFAGLFCKRHARKTTKVLLRRTEGAWRIARVREFLWNVPECERVTVAGHRDWIVCRSERRSSSAGGVQELSVFALDFARPEGQEQVELVSIVDSRDTACSGQTELVIGEIERPELVDVDRDGTLDVRVALHAGRVRVPKQPPCTEMPALPAGVPKPALERLSFLTRPERFEPTKTTSAALQRIAALRPKP